MEGSNASTRTIVAASLWSVPPERREAEAVRLQQAGLSRWHWDSSDGEFAAAGGFTPAQAHDLTSLTGIQAEAHIMAIDPGSVIEEWAAFCDSITIHVESEGWEQAIERILRLGRKAAVAIKPTTPLSHLDGLDAEIGVLVMAITPGQAGSTFQPTTLARLQHFTGRGLLGVDGGVSRQIAHECVDHGANWIVSGTDLCSAADPAEWLADIGALGR